MIINILINVPCAHNLDFEETKNKIEKEFVLDMREEHFEGREVCYKGSETKVKLKELEEKEKISDKLIKERDKEKINDEFLQHDDDDCCAKCLINNDFALLL